MAVDWSALEPYWGRVTAGGTVVLTVLGPLLTAATLVWVLASKKNATSAVAWCLVVFFLPLLGPLLFVLFGYQHVNRPLARMRRHRRRFLRRQEASRVEAAPAPLPWGDQMTLPDEPGRAGVRGAWQELARLGQRFGAYPVTRDNAVTFYHDGPAAFAAMAEAVRAARHHVHLETFIFQPDATGRAVLELLAEKARQGVEVRLLYDAMGSRRLPRALLRPLLRAGGRCSPFLPLNPLRRRIQVNLRNHRKILVVDGRVAFTGGMNVGDEYVNKGRRFPTWRDTHLRLHGPAVPGLQRIFSEDWDFAAGENLQQPDYFPVPQGGPGGVPVQVIESGPDRELKGIREMYFAAILRARERLWIATPYFVPDAGLLDALCLACHLGVDVRLLGQFHPDKWIPYFAARYYWGDVLRAGAKVYQYTRGMMHAKVMLADGLWASVGTANLDNRSLHLNFEVNCLLYAPEAVAELEAAFLRDLRDAVRLQPDVYSGRPLPGKLLENACRLLSPVL